MSLENLDLTESPDGSIGEATPKYVVQLQDFQFKNRNGWETTKLYSVSRDGRNFAFQFDYCGKSHRSGYHFKAHELAELIDAARLLLFALNKTTLLNTAVLRGGRRLPVSKMAAIA